MKYFDTEAGDLYVKFVVELSGFPVA